MLRRHPNPHALQRGQAWPIPLASQMQNVDNYWASRRQNAGFGIPFGNAARLSNGLGRRFSTGRSQRQAAALGRFSQLSTASACCQQQQHHIFVRHVLVDQMVSSVRLRRNPGHEPSPRVLRQWIQDDDRKLGIDAHAPVRGSQPCLEPFALWIFPASKWAIQPNKPSAKFLTGP